MTSHGCLLDQEKSERRRTIADAMQVLRIEAGFVDDHTATIVVGTMKLPSGVVAELVTVQYQREEDDILFVVSLPSAARFRAKEASSNLLRRDVWLLDQAVVHSDNTIVTADGSALRGVEVEPLSSPSPGAACPSRWHWNGLRRRETIGSALAGL